MKLTKEAKDGNKLLSLYRERREYEVPTLDGFKPVHGVTYNRFAAQRYKQITDEIEILSKTMGGRAKTRIRKECRAQGIKCPDFKYETH